MSYSYIHLLISGVLITHFRGVVNEKIPMSLKKR